MLIIVNVLHLITLLCYTPPMKDFIILTASPRKNGNTNSLAREFVRELESQGKSYEALDLYDLDMKPCIACRQCQKDWTKPSCARGDDEVFRKVLDAKTIVLATPIYSWYCTAPAKAFLDRCVYALNKYYGDLDLDGKTDEDGNPLNKRGPSLWKGRKLALIMTCGYPPEKGADLLKEGIKRYCKHSQLEYAGSFIGRHAGYGTVFLDEDKKSGIRAFARELAGNK